MAEYKNLVRWRWPDNYIGPDYAEYYIVYSINRDSDPLDVSNFDSINGKITAILARLGGESKTVIVVRVTHWLCGWVESILIHESDHRALELADSLLEELAEYPVLDEDDYERRLHEAALEVLADIEDYPGDYPDCPSDEVGRYEYARELVRG